MAESKITYPLTIETVNLSTHAKLVRFGKLRILEVINISKDELQGITLSANDRPSFFVQGQGVRDYNSYNITLGLLNVEPNGSMKAYLLAEYNDSQGTWEDNFSGTLNATAIWQVQ